jgi:hypothetical protein
MVVVEHKDNDQAPKQEIAVSFMLGGNQSNKMHIKSIAVFVHNDDRVEVAVDSSWIGAVT